MWFDIIIDGELYARAWTHDEAEQILSRAKSQNPGSDGRIEFVYVADID